MPCRRPVHQLIPPVAIPFLDLADKFVIALSDLHQVLVGKVPPCLFQVAFELPPLPVELISIHHRPPCVKDSTLMVNIPGPIGQHGLPVTKHLQTPY